MQTAVYIYIYILSIHPKKKNFPAPFHSRAFVLLYKFETSWALLRRLNIRFSLPFLDGSCLLWVMSTEVSVDIAVDIAVDTRSIVGRHSVDSRSILGR